MPKYAVFIDEETEEQVKEIAEELHMNVDDLLEKLIKNKILDYKVELIIQKYRNGELKAREAWKTSGLEYSEFLRRANK